jgi:hypothetical protein
MKGEKKLQAEMIKMLPDDWNYQDKLKFFENMADIYRKKSRDSVYKTERVVFKTDEGYKTGGKG